MRVPTFGMESEKGLGPKTPVPSAPPMVAGRTVHLRPVEIAITELLRGPGRLNSYEELDPPTNGTSVR